MPNPTQRGLNLSYVLIGLMLLMAVPLLFPANQTEVLPYSTFLSLLDKGEISSVTVTETRIEGTLKTPIEGRSHFTTTRVDPAIAAALSAKGVAVEGGSDSNWLTLLFSWLAPAALLILFWSFMFRGFGEGVGPQTMLGVGRSRAKLWVERDTGVTFKDVAGVDEAKAELQEAVSFLTDRTQYGRLGARVPRGILLVGPPGTGKTLLARAVAGEASVPFFSISGSEFVELFVGVGAARVRDLFETARKAAPCIIFIDELDALGRARGAWGALGVNDEKEQTLNQLLAEVDGFDPAVGIVLLAATNRPEILDPALTRAGRFDLQIVVDRPERKGRRDILAVHTRKVTLAPDVSLDDVAALTPGFTGADLASLVNEAAILATRRGATQVEMQDMTAAVERVVAGAERHSRLLNPEERRRVAVHEMGHALVAAVLPGADTVHKVSIIPRSVGALGYTMQRPTEDRFLITEPELADRMAVLLAGRAAEILTFGVASTGAEDDLAKATDIARSMVARFGMGPTIGPMTLETRRVQWMPDDLPGQSARDYSETTSREVDLDIRRVLKAAWDRVMTLLQADRANLQAGVELLLHTETVTPETFLPLRRRPDTRLPDTRLPLTDPQVAAR